jgi:MoxR-like ATPase
MLLLKVSTDLTLAQDLGNQLIKNLEKVIFGKRTVLAQVIIGLFSEGHILIEDVPGVGKTMLARSLAISTGCKFTRIQFTPDLLPSDITGISVYDQKNNIFEFRPGPVFTQILLADEINRATPKSQSALLEAMGESQVSAENITRILPKPFFVMATQNPMEYEGVFPLPESQMDRFLLRISVGYPTKEIEESILEQMQIQHPIDSLSSISTPEEILQAQKIVRGVFVSQPARAYILDIVNSTRNHADLQLGASPRASLGLLRAAQAEAVLNGRDFIIPDDIKKLAVPVLAHRLILNPEARMGNLTQNNVMTEILDSVRAPIQDEKIHR